MVSFKHFPVLDGLRGIAVLIVMCYHLEYLAPGIHTLVKGGFLGVDVFFVLSGFLITSILLKEHDQTGKISLGNFYIRRTLRLVPAFWLFLIILYFAGNVLLPREQTNFIYSDDNFLYSLTYLMNWHKATGALTGNLNHTWSLAIEEQFYIVWSLILLKAFGESRSRRQIAIGTSILVLILVVQRTVRTATGADIDLLYYSTDTRIDAILIGCVASMVYCWKLIPSHFFRTNAFNRIFLASVLCCLTILMTFEHDNPTLFLGFISLFSLSVAISIIWLVTREKTAVHRMLEIRPLRWVGEISYGLYLWHYLFYEFAKNRFEDPPAQIIIGLSLSFFAAATSFYLLERPILHFKSVWSRNEKLKRAELTP